MIRNIIQYIISWTQECEDSVRLVSSNVWKKLQGVGYHLWVHIFLTQSQVIICSDRLNHIYFLQVLQVHETLIQIFIAKIMSICYTSDRPFVMQNSQCCDFDNMLITGCTWKCHNDNYKCSQWWKQWFIPWVAFFLPIFLKTIDQYVEIIFHTPHTGIMIVGKM